METSINLMVKDEVACLSGDQVSCLVCSRSFLETRRSDFSLFFPVDKFVHVLFILKHVLKVTDKSIEKLVGNFLTESSNQDVGGRSLEDAVICNNCDESLSIMMDIHKELLEVSQDIFAVRKKLFQASTKRRVKVVCEEDDQMKLTKSRAKVKGSKLEKKSQLRPVKKKMRQKVGADIGNFAMLICTGESPMNDLVELCVEEVNDPLNPTAEDDVPLEDPLAIGMDIDPPYSPDLGSESSGDDELPHSGPPESNRGPVLRKKPLTEKPPCTSRRSRPIKKPLRVSSMTCPFCKQFSKPRNEAVVLCQHLNTCSKVVRDEEERSIICSTCNIFTTSDLLLFSEHYANCQTNSKAFQVTPIDKRIIHCDACGNVRQSQYYMFNDFLQHYICHVRFPYKCTQAYDNGIHCGARYDVQTNLNNHYRWKHLKTLQSEQEQGAETNSVEKSFVIDTSVPSVPWFCPLCNCRFPSIDLRNAHFSSDHSSLPRATHNCDHCEFSSFVQEDIQIHLTTKHSELVDYKEKFRKSYQCDICQHFLPTKESVKRHKWIVHKVGKGLVNTPCACPECTERFICPTSLVAHQIRVHKRTDLGKDPLECDLCDKKFARPSNLKNHKAAVHEGTGRIFVCEICSKAVRCKESLQRHLYRMHKVGSFREFKCPAEGCGKTYTSQGILDRHYAKNHSNTPLYNCEYCGKGYFAPGLLKKHLLYHKFPDFKVFTCELCPEKKFRTPENLSIHWKIHGPEERERLRKQGIREEEKEEFLKVVGKDFKNVKMLFKTSSKNT